MKHIFILLFTFLSVVFSQAQIVNIPDSVLKYKLVNDWTVDNDGDGQPERSVDTNNDGEIQVSEAETVLGLFVYAGSNNIYSFEGIESFVNLVRLECSEHQYLETLDLSQNVNLEKLICHSNDLSVLDISNSPNLLELNAASNALESLVLTNNSNLTSINLRNNPILVLNVQAMSDLEYLDISDNQLTTLDIVQNINMIELLASLNNIETINIGANSLLTHLDLRNNNLSSIDVTNLESLEILELTANALLNTLDVSQNLNLTYLACNNNNMDILTLGDNSLLSWLNCSYNNLNSINLEQCESLTDLFIRNNSLGSLDLSQNPNIETLSLRYSQIEYLNIKNGTSTLNDSYIEELVNNPIAYICVDEEERQAVRLELSSNGMYDVIVNSYCSFVPGGTYYTVEGEHIIDVNNDGCDSSDPNYLALKFNISNGTTEGFIVSDFSGNYELPLQQGQYTITPELENLDYFTVSPSSISVDFPADLSPFNQDFCIQPDGIHPDVEVFVYPLELARPGIEVDYKIFYKNKGNTVQSGDVNLSYNDDLMDLLSANPIQDIASTGQLTWNYSDLLPFETRTILFTMTLNMPTDAEFPVDSGDVLSFATEISPEINDEIPNDNSFVLNQTVVNSIDPNDKTCLEGATINPSRVGDYVHYMIRFENIGTASAINVVVKDDINPSYFDISTLIPLESSHDFVTRINSNKVEFIFENINLPFDDANNDGFVTFKIKTKETLELGDSFSNTAEIYFDFNAPIITNTAITTVEEPLSVSEFNLNGNITLSPNPSNGTIELKNSLGTFLEYAQVININGSIIYELDLETNDLTNSISLTLESGMYFFRLYTTEGSITKKLIIK